MDKPIIAGIAVVRNEQDIIEPFVRHNLKFLDRLLVMDNGSVDATKHILSQLRDEFPQLYLSHDNRFSDDLAGRANLLLRQCDAQFAVPLDADEFISANSREEYAEMLSTIPVGGYANVPWQTFVVHKGKELEAAVNPPWTIRYYRVIEAPQFSKVIVRLDGLGARYLCLFTGSHEVSARSGKALPSIDLPMKLLHYPVRSYEQMIGKCSISWMSYCAHNPDARATLQNYHKREIYDAIVSGEKIDLSKLSMLYAQSERTIDWNHDVMEYPVAFDYVRKYSTGDPMSAVQLIMKSWERWMGER